MECYRPAPTRRSHWQCSPLLITKAREWVQAAICLRKLYSQVKERLLLITNQLQATSTNKFFSYLWVTKISNTWMSSAMLLPLPISTTLSNCCKIVAILKVWRTWKHSSRWLPLHLGWWRIFRLSKHKNKCSRHRFYSRNLILLAI